MLCPIRHTYIRAAACWCSLAGWLAQDPRLEYRKAKLLFWTVRCCLLFVFYLLVQVPEGPLAVRLARFDAAGGGDVARRKDTDCSIS